MSFMKTGAFDIFHFPYNCPDRRPGPGLPAIGPVLEQIERNYDAKESFGCLSVDGILGFHQPNYI
jgi:hypothetical protein